MTVFVKQSYANKTELIESITSITHAAFVFAKIASLMILHDINKFLKN